MIKFTNILLESRIIWEIPNLKDEIGEYFENGFTKKQFKKYGYEFKNPNELLDFLSKGTLTSLDKFTISNNYENINLTLDKSDKDYMSSYKKMKNKLNKGNLRLPSPIIIKFGDLYYGFAGNRRMNLAWNNKVPLKVWLVEA